MHCVESEYGSSGEYMEHARMCVNDILRRSADCDGLTPVSRGMSARLSTLEHAIQSGATFQRFWFEMPKVGTSCFAAFMLMWAIVQASNVAL